MLQTDKSIKYITQVSFEDFKLPSSPKPLSVTIISATIVQLENPTTSEAFFKAVIGDSDDYEGKILIEDRSPKVMRSAVCYLDINGTNEYPNNWTIRDCITNMAIKYNKKDCLDAAIFALDLQDRLDELNNNKETADIISIVDLFLTPARIWLVNCDKVSQANAYYLDGLLRSMAHDCGGVVFVSHTDKFSKNITTGALRVRV